MRRRVALLAWLVPLILFGAIAIEVEVSPRLSWDGAVSRVIFDKLGKAPRGTDNTVILLSHIATAAGLLASVVLLFSGRRRKSVFWALSVGGALALEPVLKAVFRRPPVSGLRNDYSFPSGTAMLSTAIVVALVLTLPRAGRPIAAFIGALLLAACGVVIVELRWHYPSDVLAGWCLALAWVTGLWLLIVDPGPVSDTFSRWIGGLRSPGGASPAPRE